MAIVVCWWLCIYLNQGSSKTTSDGPPECVSRSIVCHPGTEPIVILQLHDTALRQTLVTQCALFNLSICICLLQCHHQSVKIETHRPSEFDSCSCLLLRSIRGSLSYSTARTNLEQIQSWSSKHLANIKVRKEVKITLLAAGNLNVLPNRLQAMMHVSPRFNKTHTRNKSQLTQLTNETRPHCSQWTSLPDI